MIYMTVQLCDQSCKRNIPKDLGSQLRDQFVFSRKPRRAIERRYCLSRTLQETVCRKMRDGE